MYSTKKYQNKMKTQEERIDTMFAEVKTSVMSGKNGYHYHSNIDYEIDMISRCEYRGRILDMEKHCKIAITIITKQLLKNMSK
jgi:hypothetical protein